MSHPLPPPLAAYEEGSFAHFTVQHRLPKILADVKAQLERREGEDPRWAALESAIVVGGDIDASLVSARTPFWQHKLAKLAGARWSQLPFFDLEFLFYLAVNSIVDDLRPGFDVFAAARRASLSDALPRVARVVEAADGLSLDAALLLATSGNEADLSQLVREPAGAPSISLLGDERPALTQRLSEVPGDATVQLLADNAGAELCFDLVLVDVLLEARPGPIEVQLKSQPMFVSDALPSDVEDTITGFCRADPGSRLATVGARLRQTLYDGRLVLRAPPDWAEPRPMNALAPELAASLRAAGIVLAKGDLHYRRFFEDRAWPAITPVSVASVATGMHAFAMRVLKSDSIVGLPAAVVSRLANAVPAWRSSGRHSIIQRVDQGAEP